MVRPIILVLALHASAAAAALPPSVVRAIHAFDQAAASCEAAENKAATGLRPDGDGLQMLVNFMVAQNICTHAAQSIAAIPNPVLAHYPIAGWRKTLKTECEAAYRVKTAAFEAFVHDIQNGNDVSILVRFTRRIDAGDRLRARCIVDLATIARAEGS